MVLLARMERNLRRAPVVSHRIVNRLGGRGQCLQELGGKSFAEVLCTGLRISKDDATRRLADAL